MSLAMVSQASQSSESLVTYYTTVWFFTVVSYFMCLQSTKLCAFVVTLGAAEWLVTSVGSFMSL